MSEPTKGSRHALIALSAVCVSCACAPARAQIMEPRAYSTSPVSLGFLIAGSRHLSGDVLLDPLLGTKDIGAKAR